MRKTKKCFLVLLIALFVVALGGGSIEAEAKAKARVSSVSVKVDKKKKTIKVSFKKDKKAKKYKIKKYKAKLVKYVYNEKTNKWVKSKTSYKTVNAYKGKKLKSSASVTFSNITVPNNTTAYKVQVASTDSKGSTKTNYTSSKSVGCFHDWLWESKTYQELVKEAVVEQVMEGRCDGCGVTGNLKEISSHTKTYNGRRADEYNNILKGYCQERNLQYESFDLNSYVLSRDSRLDFENYMVIYLNNKYGYTTRLYTLETLPQSLGVPTGCTGATTTGNYLDYEVSPAEYVTKTRMEATCQHCGNTRIKD